MSGPRNAALVALVVATLAVSVASQSPAPACSTSFAAPTPTSPVADTALPPPAALVDADPFARAPGLARHAASARDAVPFPPVAHLLGSGRDAPVWRVEQTIVVPTLDGLATGPAQVGDVQLTLPTGSFTVPFLDSMLQGAPLTNLVLLVIDPLSYAIVRIDLENVQVVSLRSEYDAGDAPWEAVSLRAELYRWTWMGGGPSSWVSWNTATLVKEGGATLPPELVFHPEGTTVGDEWPYLDVAHGLRYEPPPGGAGTGRLEYDLHGLLRPIDVHTIAVLSACLDGAAVCDALEVHLPDPDGFYGFIARHTLLAPVLGGWTLTTNKAGRPLEQWACDYDSLTWSVLDDSESTTHDP